MGFDRYLNTIKYFEMIKDVYEIKKDTHLWNYVIKVSICIMSKPKEL